MSRVADALRQRLVKLTALAAFTLTIGQAALAPAEVVQWTEKTYTIPELVEMASPAVVFIGILNAEGEYMGQGSGFVVKPDGFVVTNFHVIDGAQGLIVKMLDGEIYDRVRVVDYDRRRDLAVLKIPAFKELPTVPMGDSSTVKVGEEAVAIGNPQGLEHTVTNGMVSAFRKTEGYRLMQISVPISPGSSGGPLFDLRGNVIGITTSGMQGDAQNLNFAVPIEYVRPLLETKAEPVSVAEVSRGQGRSISGNGQQPASAPQHVPPEPDDIPGMAWLVAHDHGGSTFDDFCLGYLFIGEGSIGFTNDSGIHNWVVPLSGLKEAKKNTFYGSEYGAFHIKLVTGTNYNLVVVNDQLQFQSPDQVLIMITQAYEQAGRQ
jgi:V8-like Glu-specific endopeptidase